MGNPQPGWPDSDTTDAKQGTRDTEFNSELLFMPHDQKKSDTPRSYDVTLGMQRNIARLLGPAAAGLCIKKDDDGLNVGVFGIPKYQIGATTYTLPGTYPIALDASETTYLWCDADEVVETSTTAWPGTDHFKIAICTTSADAVTAILDCRPMNFGIGGANDWFNIPAGADVDMAGHELEDIGWLDFGLSEVAVISSGVITPTQATHHVAVESGTTDDLDTITPDDTGKRRLLFLLGYNTLFDTVTVKDGTGNIDLKNGDCVLHDGMMLVLYQYSFSNWMEVTRALQSPAVLANDLNVLGYSIVNQGRLNFQGMADTISGGVVSIENPEPGAQKISFLSVGTESGAATDDLDKAEDGVNRDFLILEAYNGDHTVIVKHGVGADKFQLANGLDFEMNSTEHFIAFLRNSTQWVELFRSPMRLESLVSDLDNDAGDKPSRGIPYAFAGAFLGGSLTAQVYPQYFVSPVAFTIKAATGKVVTAPTGGDCIIDVQVNGGSIFADDNERIKITDGNTQDTSATKNYQVSAGDVIRYEVLSTGSSPNGAANAVIVLDAYTAPQTAPQS